MFSKKLLLYLCLIYAVRAKKSFTIILDTSFSMREETRIIKANLRPVFQSIASNVDDFILVPFSDPGKHIFLSIASNVDDLILVPFTVPDAVLQQRTYKDTEGLMSYINSITVGDDNSECPENSMAAILKGLQVSQPSSQIFVFTDAYANDAHLFSEIENLCRQTRSQVVIFLSGFCVPTETSEEGSVEVYFNIAKVCSGTVFRMESPLTRKEQNDYAQVFKFMKEIVRVSEWDEIITYGPASREKQFSFSADELTNEVLIVVYGKGPEIYVQDSNGNNIKTEMIVDNHNSLVVKMVTTQGSEFTCLARGRNSVSLTMYRWTDLPFYYGFSSRSPVFFNLKETSTRPIAGVLNYMLIKPKSETVKVNAVTLQFDDGNTRNEIARVAAVDRNNYIAWTLIEKEKSFRMSVSLEDVYTQRNFTALTKIVKPQPFGEVSVQFHRTKPVLEIITRDDSRFLNVVYNTNVTVPCKVTGFPKPDIEWQDENGNTISAEVVNLEVPNVFISYATIVNVDQNKTLSCRARNSEGDTAKQIQLEVHRPFTFEVLLKPTSNSFEYGSEGRLDCKVDAYPPATIQWYHNSTLLDKDYISSDNDFVIDDAGLSIGNMNLDKVGTYECIARNDEHQESFTAEVTIYGVETPEVDISSELLLTPGQSAEVDCKTSRGKPKPNVSWKYKNGEDFPYGITVEETILKIDSATVEHNGDYICLAENIVGFDSKVMTIKIQYKPIITSSQADLIELKEEDGVNIDCNVDAVPEASVKWEIYQDNNLVPLDDSKIINDDYSLRFTATNTDSGIYKCIAENEVGITEKAFTVSVLARPYIRPQADTITLKTGESIDLNCTVEWGNPKPTHKWEFRAPNFPSVDLNRNTSTLHLENVRKIDEGTYICTVENSRGWDNIKINIVVE